jgi:hypothetical protein
MLYFCKKWCNWWNLMMVDRSPNKPEKLILPSASVATEVTEEEEALPFEYPFNE